jgi:actin related protein 2/3 complex subunit 1A/1B
MSSWKEKYRLGEHDMNISCIDWSPVTGQIVTCGHDRNAFVWTFNEAESKWEPSLVILRIEHAALHCKWSPNGKKFAVTSSSKCVQVCHYEADNKWWVSKQIKKPHKSSVLCVAWHPNSQMLITGGADFKCRLFSAYAPGNDATGPGPDHGAEQDVALVGKPPLSFAEM